MFLRWNLDLPIGKFFPFSAIRDERNFTPTKSAGALCSSRAICLLEYQSLLLKLQALAIFGHGDYSSATNTRFPSPLDFLKRLVTCLIQELLLSAGIDQETTSDTTWNVKSLSFNKLLIKCNNDIKHLLNCNLKYVI